MNTRLYMRVESNPATGDAQANVFLCAGPNPGYMGRVMSRRVSGVKLNMWLTTSSVYQDKGRVKDRARQE